MILYITGTNTNVGKTFLSKLLLRRARERGIKMAALKPFCSGGREDAEQLHALQTAGLTLDQVNPFHFAEPVTPLVAARNAGRAIEPAAVIAAVTEIAALGQPILIEGAGGLLSPLCADFTFRELIAKIPGRVCVVAPNILGTINSVLLTLEALPGTKADVVLMSADQPDASVASNGNMISEVSAADVFEVPFLRSFADRTPEVIDRLLANFLKV